VSSVVVQANGKILVAGGFFKSDADPATTRNGLARLNADGTLDSVFDAFSSFVFTDSFLVNSILVQPNGRIVVGGQIGGSSGFLKRLLADGTTDTSFSPTPIGIVFAVARQSDGKILFGGTSQVVGDLNRTLVRVAG
jgi:uncharacterized delta-60 repeat protein